MCNRSPKEVEPFLFQLFESKIDGVFYPNLYIIAGINLEEDTHSNIDFSDKALRRRVVWFDYKPNKKTFADEIKKRQYHPTIIEVADMMDLHYNHETKTEMEISSTYGSWSDWNNRLIKLSIKSDRNLTINEITDDFMNNYTLYFNEKLGIEVLNKLNDIKSLIKINIQKDIIETGTLPEKYKHLEEELYIRTKNFIVRESIKDKDYLGENAAAILKLFAERKEFVMITLAEISDTMKADKFRPEDIQAVLKSFVMVAKEDKKLLISLNTLFMARD